MKHSIAIHSGHNARAMLAEHCRSRGLDSFLLVADPNTYAALGQRVEEDLKTHDWDVRTVILDGDEVLADEKRVFDVLFRAHGEERVYVAVGSGTITDITRYASFCSRNPFIALPTAPSVDAYASGGAALLMGGFKLTVPSHAPSAIFVDIPTLCEAPRDMIAAGFGDMLGKYTSLADWQLGALLLDEAYGAEISARAERALLDCVAHAEEIGRALPEGITALMDGLSESGLCMLEFESSRPASGAEHLLSHFWETKLIQEGRPGILHGAKVGVGTILAAQRYEVVRSLSCRESTQRLSLASLPSLESERTRIRSVFGPAANRIIAHQIPFLRMLEAHFQILRQRISEDWDEIQAIAARVPPAHQIIELLELAGGPSTPDAIGLSEEDVTQALSFSRYMRGRFTVDTLGHILGLW
jgi:glycerol-1-phosphate dehydrogenase [NAD(P)+]